MGWGTPVPPPGKPDPREDLERLQPFELPFVDMARWKSNNPFASDGSGGETAFKLAETLALEVLGHYVEVLHPVAWIHLGYEILHVIMGLGDGPGPAAPAHPSAAQLEAWNAYVQTAFWNKESAFPSADSREAAFDRLAGDNANHGVVPKLTKEAELKRQELIYEINGRWLLTLEVMQEAKQKVEGAGHLGTYQASIQASANEARRNAELYVLMDPARAERERQRAEFFEAWAADYVDDVRAAGGVVDSYKADMTKVLEFEANPGNWDLTEKERALLPDNWQPLFAERDALQAQRDELAAWLPYQHESNPYRQQAAARLAQTDEALQGLKDRMAAEAAR